MVGLSVRWFWGKTKEKNAVRKKPTQDVLDDWIEKRKCVTNGVTETMN